MDAIASAFPGYVSFRRVAAAVVQLVTAPVHAPNVAASLRNGVLNAAHVTAVETLNLATLLLRAIRLPLLVAQGACMLAAWARLTC